MNVLDFSLYKQQGKKITMLTCYDYSFASILAETELDCILVGDSLMMTMHGDSTTLNASIEVMALHTKAVAKAISKQFLVADMPFLAHRRSLADTIDAVKLLMQAGAHGVKIEGADGNIEMIRHIVESGVPVMGHLGLTPQSFHALGGYKVQGKQIDAAKKIMADAKALEEAGCFALVLECVPRELAKSITESLSIPTIGIGAGHETDGQVLVLQDILGMNDQKTKFVKPYLPMKDLVKKAMNHYVEEVRSQVFPSVEYSYSGEK